MRIQAVIDRFESDKAVLLVGNEEVQVVWLRCKLPGEAKEGDILKIDIQIDSQATSAAKADAERLLQEILEKNQESL